MAKVLIDDTYLSNIANSIRAKSGSSETMKPSEMASNVTSIYVGTDTRDANASAKDIALNKTAYVNEVKLTGTHNKDKDVNSNVFKSITIKLNQSDLANYYLQEFASGNITNARFQGYEGELKELNSNGVPKIFTLMSPNTAPYMIALVVDNVNYIYFDTNFTNAFIQLDTALGTNYVQGFLTQTGLTLQQLQALSGWYNTSTFQPILADIVVNDIILTQAFYTTLGDFLQSGSNFHFIDTQQNIEDSLFNVEIVKYDGILEATDIRAIVSRIYSRDYLNDTTANQSDIANGKTAYINGAKVTGSHQGPSGSLSITTNGTHDVTNYASADVQVPSTGTQDVEFSEPIVTSSSSTVSSIQRSITKINNLNLTQEYNNILRGLFCNMEYLTYINPNIFSGLKPTDVVNCFRGCTRLKDLPSIDTSETTDFTYFLRDIASIKTLPLYSLESATTINDMFNGLSTNGSTSTNTGTFTDAIAYRINEILLTLNEDYTGAKTLATVGINGSNRRNKIQAQSNWQDLVDLGWSVS